MGGEQLESQDRNRARRNIHGDRYRGRLCYRPGDNELFHGLWETGFAGDSPCLRPLLPAGVPSTATVYSQTIPMPKGYTAAPGRERLTLAFELMADVFCLAGYCIMLSGCGAILEESWNLNYTMTIFLLSVFLIWCLSRELSGLAAANKLLLSVILALTIVIGSACISDRQGISETSLQGEKGSWLMSSLLYVSYNGTLALVVLSSLGSYTDRVGAALGGAAIGALGIMLMAGLMWFITWVNYPGLYGAQVPLLQVARPLGNLLFLSSVIVLLAAMITTALGLGFAFARSVSKRFGLSYKRAIYFLLIGIPLAKYNFAALINTIYPFFGKLGIIFAIFLAIKQVFKHENRMI